LDNFVVDGDAHYSIAPSDVLS